MAKPVKTQELLCERTVPDCPHCGGDMSDATVKLWDIIEAANEDEFAICRIRVDQHLAVDAGGYTDAEGANIVATCPACGRPSALALDGTVVELFAARTEIDRRFLEAQGRN